MIPALELYIKELLTEELSEIRANPNIINKMFSLVGDARIAEFKQFISSKPVTVGLSYPRNEQAELPTVRIFLNSEEQENMAIGDVFETFYLEDEEMEEFQMGVLMNFNFRIELWGDNPELVTYLYYLIKFIILSNRKAFSEHGIINPTMTGGDLEPLPEYFPVFVWRKAVILRGKVENSYTTDFETADPDIVLRVTMYGDEIYRSE